MTESDPKQPAQQQPQVQPQPRPEQEPQPKESVMLLKNRHELWKQQMEKHGIAKQ